MIVVPEGYILIKELDYFKLKEDHEKLLKLVATLMNRVAELESQLNKNSRNSSKPPSSNGLKKVIKNNRETSDKKPGGQTGHSGSTLKMVECADKIILHKVKGTCICGESLGKFPVRSIHRRQVFNLPVKRIEVTEHKVETKQCSCGKIYEAKCKVGNHVQYGSRFKAMMVYLNQYQFLPFERLQELSKDCFGISVSDGVLEQNNSSCFEQLEETELAIKNALMNSPVIHNDETGIRCQSKTQWIHSASTTQYTHYNIHRKRGVEAINEIGILKQYEGISVHDRWSSYDQYNCTHSFCNAHLLRHLKFLNEEMECHWAGQMKSLLIKANDYKKEDMLNEMLIDKIENQYCKILREGIAEQPPDPVPQKVKRGRKAKSKSARLLDVFNQRSQNVLMFIYNPDVPFDNDLAERDLSMVKLKQKISGCFRSETGAKTFCRIRSYISTVSKQGQSVMDAIQLAIINKPIAIWVG
ncbi:MAG: IS66 family transposase [Bacteroidia bacterium]|nr:IS66 family transposase [Bacteroidia bacterium]